jgi:hypothetical protein
MMEMETEGGSDSLRSWLKNKIHCGNIMNPKFKKAVVGFAKSNNGRSYWTLILGYQINNVIYLFLPADYFINFTCHVRKIPTHL